MVRIRKKNIIITFVFLIYFILLLYSTRATLNRELENIPYQKSVNRNGSYLLSTPHSSSLRIAIITIVENRTSFTEYIEAMSSVSCYARIHKYEYRIITADVQIRRCAQKEMFFRRHCILASILNQYDYILFLDADIGVVNPNKTIESYIEENVEILFYDRFYTYEVMAGTYLVKNSDWSRNFLDGWANYEYRLPRSFHGSDNGVLNIYLVEWIAPSRHIELNLCQQIWNNSRNWNGVFTFTACVRDILGDQTNYGKIKILKKGTGWARDSFLTNGRWNPSRDFMLHDMKAKYRRYRKPLSLASPLRTLEMHLWYNPFVGEFDLNLCRPGNSSWNYVSYLIAPVSALEERYRKKYLEVHFEKLRTLGGIREFFGNSEFERTLSEPWNNGVQL